MRVLISGATGLIGSALQPALTSGGHQTVRLTRSEPLTGELEARWEPETGQIDAAALSGVDAAVHLAGESINGRWIESKKRRIHDSRAKGTRLLAETLAALHPPPRVLVSASAVGYYGNRGDEMLTEENGPGAMFLSEVCKEWEAATKPAEAKGIRVVTLRFGLVLSPKGGALKQLLRPFRLGAGGVIGNGRQYMSWIAIDDAVGAIQHSLVTESLWGPANAVSPNPVSNREFTKTLGRVLRRPTILPLPDFIARLAFGRMADDLLLASQRALPEKLVSRGYAFHFPDLEGALRHLLGG